MSAVSDAVRSYLDRGWSVTPLVRGTKEPPKGFQWGEYSKRRPERAEWSAWWQRWPDCNLSVVLAGCDLGEGRQLVCVDTDTPEAEAWVQEQGELPPTPTAATAKGLHRYYAAPVGLQHYAGNREQHKPEVRAGEHYMVLPPSLHPSGVAYRWLDGLSPDEVAVADLLAWGCELMRGEGEPQLPPTRATEQQQRSAYGQIALAREVGELTTTLQGGRNDALNAAAYSLGQLVGGGELAEEEVAQALLRACQGNGLLKDDGQTACERTIRSGLAKGRLEPRQGSYRPAAQPRREQPAPPPEPGVPPLPPEPAEYAQAAAAVNSVRVAQPPPQTPPVLHDVADTLIRQHEEYRGRPRIISGLRTGFATLDWHFLGFANHRLVIIHGPSGYGKTTFAKHAIFATGLAAAIDGSADGLGVYLLEGQARDLLSSYLGYRGEVPRCLRAPGAEQHLTPEWQEVIDACCEEFRSLPLYVEDREEFRDIGRLEASIRCLAEQRPLSGIVIDHAQEIICPGVPEGHQTLNQVAERARNISEDLALPLALLSQTKLVDGEYRPEYSARLQQKATLSLFVGRGAIGQKREQAVLSNVTRVTCDKCRGDEGPSLPLTLYGDWQTGRLWEADQEPQEQTPLQEQGEKEQVFEWPNN